MDESEGFDSTLLLWRFHSTTAAIQFTETCSVTERRHGLAHDEVDHVGHVATALDVAIGHQAGLGQRLTVLVQRGRARSTGADADAVTMKGALIVIGRDHLDAGSIASPRGTESMADGSDAVATSTPATTSRSPRHAITGLRIPMLEPLESSE